MGGCCGGPKAPKNDKTVPKPEKKEEEGAIEKRDEENPAPADGEAPAADGESPPADGEGEKPADDAAEEEKVADGEDAPAASPEGEEAPVASGEPAQHIALVSTKAGPEIVYDADALERTDEPEVYGDIDWSTLFQTMKSNAEEAGKDVPVRISRRDPEDSQANLFYMAEQIFDAVVEDKKSPPSLIDLHVIRCKEALQNTSDRLVQIQDDLDNQALGGRITPNVGDGKSHIFKILCGQGTHSEKDENGNSLTVMKYAMKQWLIAHERPYTCSMHHGCFFILFEVDNPQNPKAE